VAGSDRPAVTDLSRRLGVEGEALQELLAAPYEHYRTAYIRKKNGTRRRLRVPSDDMKAVQKAILRTFLTGMDSHPANQCRRGRSVIKNAELHLGHKWIVAQDIRNCFPSVRPTMVRRTLQAFRIEERFIPMLVSLCTLSRQLPQGAPTSPAILSGVLRSLDEDLTCEADKQGLTYTRYVDDLFVSGNRQFPGYERFLVDAVNQAGFELAPEKRKKWGPSSPATLAGVVLTTELNPTPEFERSLSTIVEQVAARTITLDEELMAQLRGRITWMEALSPERARRIRSKLSSVGGQGV